jgi:hypothetical protein
MTATITRQMTFTIKDRDTKRNVFYRSFDAGTAVHVTVRRGRLIARVKGSEFTQSVATDDLRIS